MDKVSKVLFKEIMFFVKEFEALGNKWCEEEDLASVARARSYGKKIISAMKPFIEESIKETEAAIAAEAAAAIVEVPVVVAEPVVEVLEPVMEPVIVPAVEEVISVVDNVVEEVKVDVVPEVKVEKDKNKGSFNFNKRK